jgi:hypothetical protein
MRICELVTYDSKKQKLISIVSVRYYYHSSSYLEDDNERVILETMDGVLKCFNLGRLTEFYKESVYVKFCEPPK